MKDIVFKSKYAISPQETHNDMHARMAKEFARIESYYIPNENKELKQRLSFYGRKREPLSFDKIYHLFKDYKYIVPQGSVMSNLGNPSKITSLSNCFVVGQPEDSYGGILYKDQELVQLYKRRGGVGIDISSLRPATFPVNNAANNSTGAVSFMERFSHSTREAAQNGRRGALMISIDVRHPDIFEFATIKNDLSKVTGANISIQLRDDFMQAVKDDKDYVLRWPCTDENIVSTEELLESNFKHNTLYTFRDLNIKEEETLSGCFKIIRARELWDVIIKSAHQTAEPGLMFLDKHWDYSPDSVYPQYKGVTTNP